MRIHSFTQIIGYAYSYVEKVLFRPFNVRQWLKWVGIAMLAGHLTVGVSVFDFFQFSNSFNAQETDKQQSVATPSATEDQTKTATSSESSAKSVSQWSWDDFKGWVLLGAIVLGVILFVLGVVLWWLGAVCEFVWLKILMNPQGAFKPLFKESLGQGNQLFKFYLLNFLAVLGFIAVITLLVMAILAMTPDGMGILGGQWWLPATVGVLGVALLVFWLVVIVGIYVRNFVTTIMVIDQLPFIKAWQRFWDIYMQSPKDFWQYFLSLILIEMVAGTLAGVAILAVVLLLLLSGLIVIGSLYAVLVMVLKMKILFAICAVIAGIPLLLTAIGLGLMVILPIATFRRSYALYFLSSLNVGYRPLPIEELT